MLAVVILCFLASIQVQGQADEKTVLVVIENIVIRDTHFQFFKLLSDRNYQLTFKYADDSSLNLKRFGEYAYRNVIIFAPTTREFGGYIDVKALTDFVDNGGNVLVAGNKHLGEAIREFASECGVEFDDENSSVIDHNVVSEMDGGDHTLIVVDPENIANISVIVGNVKDPILYRGIGISSDPENPLLVNILHASKTSYSYATNKAISDYPSAVGKNTQLITALQARNDARVVFVGSLDMFSDAFFSSTVVKKFSNDKVALSGNKELTNHLLRWTFQEAGLLRVRSVTHYKVGDSAPQNEYTITDDIVFTIDIETKDENGAWIEYIAHDVQVELVRIDPFIRRNLPHKGHHYEIQMKLPDVYGVFKLVVDYHRVGYTSIFSATQISVRPFTHLQYERFITVAYPYYASAVSMMFGVFAFSFVFLYLRDGQKSKTE